MNELLIFAKYPEPGRVKTRLAQTVGPVEAARRYREMVETVMQKSQSQNGEYHRTLCFDPSQREDDFRKWFPSLEMRPQSEGDLGKRMSAAFQQSLTNGSDRVLLIGTDCVEIDHSLLYGAFQQLEKVDLVLGPTKDGGYYLIGMNRGKIPLNPPLKKGGRGDLFTGISWSTEKVLDETLEKAKGAGLTVELLPTLSDLDEES